LLQILAKAKFLFKHPLAEANGNELIIIYFEYNSLPSALADGNESRIFMALAEINRAAIYTHPFNKPIAS
jgi:hypothetical protein